MHLFTRETDLLAELRTTHTDSSLLTQVGDNVMPTEAMMEGKSVPAGTHSCAIMAKETLLEIDITSSKCVDSLHYQ